MPSVNGASQRQSAAQSRDDRDAPHTDHYDLVIIGAGIAGLSAGQKASEAGKSVLILDKGRRIGGRVATRRADGFVFNHGAQFMTARDPSFHAACADAVADGSLTTWPLENREALIGAPFMRAFPAFLGTGLDIRQECEITTITRSDDAVRFATTDGVVATASAAIISAPAPQTAKLVSTIAPELVPTAMAASYAPCWTALLGFDRLPAGIPDTAYQAAPGTDDIIGWAVWEHQRPGATFTAADPKYALTIQAGPTWSAAHIDQERPDNLATLTKAYEDLFGVTLGTPHYAAAHRWLYAKVLTAAPQDMPRLSACQRIAIAGDWLGGARIEQAFLSGQAAVHALYG